MEDLIGILLIYPSPKPYLEEELVKRQFKLFRLWEIPPASQRDFLRSNSQSIRAIIGNASVGPDAEMIDLLPKLEIVASHSVGLDQVDLKKCREREIMVVNTPDVLTDDVADLAIGLAIATLRQICAADRHVRSGSWMIKGDYRLTAKFSGKAVGIVGLGRIGLAVARRAEAFGCPIGYYSRSEKPETGYKYYSSVAELAGSSQVLVLACALTVETRHAISREIIEALGPSGVLVNVGRGELVDETELVSALVEGRLGGAGLDVFEREPFEPPQELMALGNVVMLPHVGSGTWETRKVMADLLVANLEAYVLRKPLLTPVL